MTLPTGPREASTAFARASRNAHEVYLLAACTLAGIVGLTVPSSHGRAISAAFPGWIQIAWYSGLIFGAVLSLYGVMRGSLSGALVERAGQLVLAGFATAYGAALLSYAGWPAAATALITVAFGAACLARACQIRASITALRSELASIAARGGQP
jgi:hypothetical protein